MIYIYIYLVQCPCEANSSKTCKNALEIGKTSFNLKKKVQLRDNNDFQTVLLLYLRRFKKYNFCSKNSAKIYI